MAAATKPREASAKSYTGSNTKTPEETNDRIESQIVADFLARGDGEDSDEEREESAIHGSLARPRIVLQPRLLILGQ